MLLTTSGEILGLPISAFLFEIRGRIEPRSVKNVAIIYDLEISFLPLYLTA